MDRFQKHSDLARRACYPLSRMAQVSIPKIKMNDGREIPALGCGTWLGFNDKFELELKDAPKLMEALSYAIDIGYRHIDGAHFSRIEPEIGKVIKKKIGDGVVTRKDLFITTKVWNNYHRASDVELAVRDSLRRLQLQYVDLLMIHFPMSISVDGEDEEIDYLETWRGMEMVQDKGLAKSIGVCNFNLEQVRRLLHHCDVPPACNQIEVNLNLGQEELVSFCQANNIVVVGFSPFGSMVPAKSKPGAPGPKLNNTDIVQIAMKYSKTVPQVTLRYLYQRGIATIPKTIKKPRILENASIFDFELTKAEMDMFRKFDNGYRSMRPVCWEHFKHYPFEMTGDDMEIPMALLKWKNGVNANID